MTDIEVFLPFPVSTNNYYVKTQRGVYISAKGRKYRDDAHVAIMEQLGADFKPIDEPMMIQVIWYPPDKRTRDYDNFLGKSFHDALTQAGLWEDDSLIRQSFIYKGEVSRQRGGVYLRITEAGPVLPLGFRFD